MLRSLSSSRSVTHNLCNLRRCLGRICPAMRLFDNLYAYPWTGNDNNCNSYVFAGTLNGGKHVIVDPGHTVTPAYREPALDRLIHGMARDGLNASDIGLVVLSHGHPDHCEAGIALRDNYGSLVALHSADEPAYRRMGGKVDLFLDEGELELGPAGSTIFRIYHSPGHTPGHITLYWPERRVLIAGDCIFYRSTGRTDFPGGSARELAETIKKLADLEIEHLLCGHAYGNSGIISGEEEVRDNFRAIGSFLF